MNLLIIQFYTSYDLLSLKSIYSPQQHSLFILDYFVEEGMKMIMNGENS
jgi:hypothetical protein